jgi:hypothetical protein
MTASVPKRVGPFESPLTARAGPYMSPLAVDHCDGLLQRRLPGVNQTVIVSQIRVSKPCSSWFTRVRIDLSPTGFTSIILEHDIRRLGPADMWTHGT